MLAEPVARPSPFAHQCGRAFRRESFRASGGQPLAHSHGTNTSPTTGCPKTPSRA